jgi:hypothetical protein
MLLTGKNRKRRTRKKEKDMLKKEEQGNVKGK